VPVFAIKRKNPFNEKLFTGEAPEADLNPYARLITDEARRRGIAVDVIDAAGGFFNLNNGGRPIRCRESLSEFTTAVAMSICDDKRVTRRIVEGAGIKVREMNDTLESILEKYVGCPVELIPCGGGDRIAAEREQWNDGSNTLCIAPGKIVVYERNDVTNKVLRDKGLDLIIVPSAELSRGRGGPRGMSMPIERED